MTTALEWLTADGYERKEAVCQAASCLLTLYRQRYHEKGRPINVFKVAETLNVGLVRIWKLKEGARLIPKRGGFQILIDSSLFGSRLRTSIAHELAHSLFYHRNSDPPKRLAAPTRREHNFCFDVARYVLAPQWLLDEADVFGALQVGEMLEILTNRLWISRTWAARVILGDYEIAYGFAGRWQKGRLGWSYEASSGSASPGMAAEERAICKTIAKQWLEEGAEPETGYYIHVVEERPRSTRFLVIVRTSRQGGGDSRVMGDRTSDTNVNDGAAARLA